MSNIWIMFWGGLLGITLIAYTVLVYHVTIGGYQDIQDMFRKLRDRDKK